MDALVAVGTVVGEIVLEMLAAVLPVVVEVDELGGNEGATVVIEAKVVVGVVGATVAVVVFVEVELDVKVDVLVLVLELGQSSDGGTTALLSSVTAPFSARARPPLGPPPTPMLAPVSIVMLVIAMIVP